MIDTYFTLKEVRIRLGVSRATLWRWREDRGLRAVSIGGVKRIRESDLHAFLERHQAETAKIESTAEQLAKS